MQKLATASEQGAPKVTSGVSEETAEARERMRQKVRTIARMARMFKTLRQENETVLKLKGVCPGHRLAPGLLLAGKERLTSELEMFDHASNVDNVNEKRPEVSGTLTDEACGFRTHDCSGRDFMPDLEEDDEPTKA